MCCSALVYAQGLGDYMEIDGVPGFVFSLDESGEHGLVMSFPELTEKKLKKFSDFYGEAGTRLCIPGKDPKKVKVSSKDMKSYQDDLVTLLSDEGKQNKAIIADYCKEKNLDYTIFKGQDFAAHLGEGWFIPGDKELTLFAEFFIGGLGEDHGLKGVKAFVNRHKELSNDPKVQFVLQQVAFYGILSSTIKESKWGFRALTRYEKTLPLPKTWLELDEKIRINPNGGVPIYKSIEDYKYLNTCAVHEF